MSMRECKNCGKNNWHFTYDNDIIIASCNFCPNKVKFPAKKRVPTGKTRFKKYVKLEENLNPIGLTKLSEVENQIAINMSKTRSTNQLFPEYSSSLTPTFLKNIFEIHNQLIEQRIYILKNNQIT